VPAVTDLGVSQATLDAIASCESGGDPTAVNAAGYYGKYQFDLFTWASVGGSGNPAEAPETEQDYRAALLYQRAGASPWPNCGA
jgi:soluble lytic murein transglycosylase-like protein